ncbi:hypothetical protein N3K66_006849 [Trichothecium roseum]|uniref:Uncharacterized protein n=1 Tax=Trichothecium roseum TaxID=47278 RepID=A0ACC0UWK3_9HYPO|nr:hypothetical protein N3K66_006849 [Trichothecium roseum]
MATPRNTSPTPDGPGKWVISKFGGPEVLRWERFDFASAMRDDEVLVRIITAGIAGPDNIQRVGGYPSPRCREPGFTPGYDFVGEVVALGASSTVKGDGRYLAVGDRVAAMCTIGAHATHISLPPSELIRLEPTDDPVAVCALPLNYMTAYGMLRRSGVDLVPGLSILIGSASGGVGTAVAQLVAAFDMGITMIGTCSPSKFDFVRSLGVEPVDRRSPDLAARVRALTPGGKGVDVAYDAVGSRESLRQSHEATKRGTGSVVAIGAMSEIAADGSGLVNGGLDADAFFRDRMQPRMKYWGVDREYYHETRHLWLEDFGKVLDKVRAGELRPVIAGCYRLGQAVETNEELVSGANVKGKMIFVVDEALAAEKGI